MNRCSKPAAAWRALALGAALAGAGLLATAPAQAQMVRPFPAKAERGAITFDAPPQVTLNGKAERLGPGVRVRDLHNRVALSGSLRGQTFTVNYLRDPAGVIREIWILSPAEIERDARGGVSGQARPAPASGYLN